MKEFIILHPHVLPLFPGLVLCPDILPHSQQDLRCPSGLAAPALGKRLPSHGAGAGSEESQTTLHACTYPSDGVGAAESHSGQLRRKHSLTGYSRLTSAGACRWGAGMEALEPGPFPAPGPISPILHTLGVSRPSRDHRKLSVP